LNRWLCKIDLNVKCQAYRFLLKLLSIIVLSTAYVWSEYLPFTNKCNEKVVLFPFMLRVKVINAKLGYEEYRVTLLCLVQKNGENARKVVKLSSIHFIDPWPVAIVPFTNEENHTVCLRFSISSGVKRTFLQFNILYKERLIIQSN
jgi:hypothetical protein